MAFESQRRIPISLPNQNVESLSLLAGSHPSLITVPPSWRRGQATGQRQAVLLSWLKRQWLPLIAVTSLIVLTFLLDVRIQIGALQKGYFPTADISNETILDDNQWRGYDHYLRRIEGLSVDKVKESQHLKVTGRGPYGFVQFSSYRTGPTTFSTVGFGARALQQTTSWSSMRCWWEGSDKAIIRGKATVLYSEEQHESIYDVIVISCTLDQPTGADGGSVTATVDSETIVLYREKTGVKHEIETPVLEYVPHFVTMCTPSVRDPLEGRTLVEFMEFHKKIGIHHFMMYDAGSFDRQLADTLDSHLVSQVLEVVPFREVKKFEIHEEGMLLALHDCLYRSRMNSRWVMVASWDEYLYTPPKSSVRSLLAENNEKSWLTYGTLMWSITFCRPGPPLFSSQLWTYSKNIPFSIERMVFHWPHIVCHGPPPGVDPKFCVGGSGERKYFADPRKVHTLRPFEVGVSDGDGLDLSFDVMHHWRFANLHLLSNFSSACGEVKRDDEKVDWWVRDGQLSRHVMKVRERN